MSKTFKSSSQANDNRTLSVEKLYGEPRLLISGDVRMGFLLDPSDAPALALAILEAAGGRDSLGIDVGNAMIDLHEYVSEQERATAEAKEQAELEAEAQTLYLSYYSAIDAPCQDWDFLPGLDKRRWLAVARRAREMRNEKKEPTND